MCLTLLNANISSNMTHTHIVMFGKNSSGPLDLFSVLYFSNNWWGSTQKVYKALQELQGFVLMLCRIGFIYHISCCLTDGWITVVLKLIYVIKIVQVSSSFQIYLLNLNQDEKHGITNSSIHTNLFQCGSQLSLVGDIHSRKASYSSHSSSGISTLGSIGCGFVGIFLYQWVSALFLVGTSITSRSLRVESLQPYLAVSGKFYFPPTAIVLSKLLAEQVTGQYRLLLMSCWMKASWLPTVHGLLEYVPCWWSMVKSLIQDISVDWMLKGMPLLSLTLWLLRDVSCI